MAFLGPAGSHRAGLQILHQSNRERVEGVDFMKKYYGALKYGQLMAECLKLYVRLADGGLDQSELAITANDGVIRSVIEEELLMEQISGAESGCLKMDLYGIEDVSCVTGYVEIADKNLLVLTLSLSFTRDKHYLIYDATLRSLSTMPHVSADPFCQAYFPNAPLPVRYGDEYTLVLFARNLEYQEEEGCTTYRDVLCLWPPPPSSELPPLLLRDTPRPSIEPWHFKEPFFPEGKTPSQFHHHESDLFDSYSVNFSFIELPHGCECDALDMPNTGPAEMYRTMGCTSSGRSIKFVSISFQDSMPVAEKTMTMWTLDTTSWGWTKGEELSLGTLWELEDFKKNGLPETEPIYPLLRKEEDEDNVLYFMLSRSLCRPISELGERAVHHMCRFDMRSKRLESSPLSCPPDMVVPQRLLGSEFFRYLDSHVQVPGCGKGKRKLNED
uniref:DUF1618 domain-containing protein n=1 Tax=Oryza punctata TaxID=4537 RepID=A0A0E0KJ58_ORYPU